MEAKSWTRDNPPPPAPATWAPPVPSPAAQSSHPKPAPRRVPAASMARGASFLLASPSDPADPYIVAQAAALNHDPNRIFAFVRDQIAFQAYHGSVRGARGALWSAGGNSLDRASLLVALLGAAGIPANYVQGSLTLAQEQTLINSMFPTPSRIVGCIPAGTTLASPANDPNLQASISDHYWVEFGSPTTSADPNFPGAQLGQTFTAAQQRFTAIPAALKQMVTISLNVETAGSNFGAVSVNGTTTVLTQSFESALLVGMPVSLANTVSGGVTGFGGFTTTNYTYTPYFLMGQGSADIEKDPIVTGSPYTEALSLFGSTFVSGIFLVVTAPNAQGSLQTYQHTIVDRIGFANRQANNLNPTPPDPTSAPPVILYADIVTVNVLPGLQSSAAFSNQQTRVQTEQQRLATLQPQVQALSGATSLTTQQQATLTSAITAQTDLEIALAELTTMTFAATADKLLGQLQSEYLSDAYYNSPRVVVGASTSAGVFTLDLLKRDIQVIPSPGQNATVAFWFENNRGLVESSSEGKILKEVLGQTSIDVSDVFAALPSGGVIALVPAVAGLVPMPALSADAVARINVALQNNKAVVAPAQTPTINGNPVNMWLEVDMTTGETVGVADTGYHQGSLEFITALLSALYGRQTNFIGSVAGFGVTGYAFAAGVLNGVAAIAGGAAVSKGSVACIKGGSCSSSPLAPYVIQAFSDLNTTISKLPSCCGNGEGKTLASQLVSGLKFGVTQSENVLLRALPADPDVFPFLSSDIVPGPAAVAPGATPSVSLTLTLDSFFTQPYTGGDASTVFIANVQNTGPATQTYNLTVQNIPGYQLIASVPSITVPAGQTGQVGICAIPLGNSVPPVMLSVTATSTANPTVTSANTTAVTGGSNLAACTVTNHALPSVADAQRMVNQSLGAATPSNDVNGDGAVNVIDVQIVMNSVLGFGCTL